MPSPSAFGQYQTTSESPRAPPQRGYTSEDPWSLTRQPSGTLNTTNGASSLGHGTTSSFAGTGLPKDWWKKQETVFVNVLGQQGFILNRYLVYEISSDVSRTFFISSSLNSMVTARCTCTQTIFGVRFSVGLSRKTISFQASPGIATQTSWT